MFVDRRTFVAKQGKQAAAVATLKQLGEEGLPGVKAWRVYGIFTGPWRHVAVEAEFESLADIEGFNIALGAKMTPERWKEWFELTGDGGGGELWVRAE
jgi:hypothetical protein